MRGARTAGMRDLSAAEQRPNGRTVTRRGTVEFRVYSVVCLFRCFFFCFFFCSRRAGNALSLSFCMK